MGPQERPRLGEVDCPAVACVAVSPFSPGFERVQVGEETRWQASIIPVSAFQLLFEIFLVRFTYLKAEREGEGDLDHPSEISWLQWLGTGPGQSQEWNSAWVQGPKHSCHLLLPSQAVSRELDWKCSSWDTKWHPYGMLAAWMVA